MWNNLSKTFRYVNEEGGEIVFNFENGFLINKPKGIDTVSVQLTQAQGIDQVGSTVQSKNIQPRPVVFTGRLVGKDQTYNKDLLLEVVRPDIKGVLYADNFYLNVVPTAAPDIQPEERFADFVFSLLAPYPFWQAQENKQKVLSGLKYCFKFPVNFSQHYRFAEAMDQQIFVLKNRGQLPVPFRTVISTLESASNFKLINVRTGEMLFLKKTFAPGERVVINNTHDRIEVLSSVDGDVTGALTISSNFFRLRPGDNVVKPEFEEGKKFAKVFIEYAEEKAGITL